jgi:hypothetical protein
VRLFNLSLLEKALGGLATVNRNTGALDSIEPRATFLGNRAL